MKAATSIPGPRPSRGQFVWVYPAFSRHLWERRSMLRLVCAALMGVGVLAAAICTLTPSGDISPQPWLPEGLRHWINANGQGRNVPAYLLLTIPTLIAFSRRYARLALMLLVTGAGLIEVLQLAVPRRTFDGMDVLLSWIGVLLGWMFVEACHKRLLSPILVRKGSR